MKPVCRRLPTTSTESLLQHAGVRYCMAHILIVDDHAVVRAGLRQFLLDDARITKVDEADSGQQAMDVLRRDRYDLMILDINMPGRNGLDILRNATSAHPETRVLIISGYPERQYAVNVLKAGASGYISKESAPEELLKAVHTVLAGRRYVSAALAEQLVTDLDVDKDKPIHSSLSEREFQIFCKLATGKTVSDIAGELCLSVKTVSTYRSRVLEKMNFVSNADITTYALRNGLTQ
jgi:two-component system, NarL family, invasion response regulator UvrY